MIMNATYVLLKRLMTKLTLACAGEGLMHAMRFSEMAAKTAISETLNHAEVL